MTARLTVLALIAAALAAAPASASGPRPLLASPFAQDVGLAGSDVIVTSAAPLGSIHVDALPSAGGPARRLLTTAEHGDDFDAFSEIAASPARIAVIAFAYGPAGESLAELYTGRPSGPLTLVERADDSSRFSPVDVDVDGDRVLVVEASRHAYRFRLLVPGAAPRIVRPRVEVTGPTVLAGERVAVQSDERIVIVDLATGAHVKSVPVDDNTQLDLAADGTLLADGAAGVFMVQPNGLRQGVPDGDFLTAPAFAGGAIAALEQTPFESARPAVLAPGAIHPRAIGIPSASISELVADSRGAAWLAHGCVLYAPLDATAPAEPPAGPCPRAEADVDSASYTLRGRKLRMVATCVAAPASGCEGTVRVNDGGLMGRGAFHVPSGRQRHFSVRFTRSGVRAVRRSLRHEDIAYFAMTTRVVDGGPPDRLDEAVIDKVR